MSTVPSSVDPWAGSITVSLTSYHIMSFVLILAVLTVIKWFVNKF